MPQWICSSTTLLTPAIGFLHRLQGSRNGVNFNISEDYLDVWKAIKDLDSGVCSTLLISSIWMCGKLHHWIHCLIYKLCASSVIQLEYRCINGNTVCELVLWWCSSSLKWSCRSSTTNRFRSFYSGCLEVVFCQFPMVHFIWYSCIPSWLRVLSGMQHFRDKVTYLRDFLRPTSHTRLRARDIALQALSLVDKAEPVQVRFTIRLRNQWSKQMQGGCKVYMDTWILLWGWPSDAFFWALTTSWTWLLARVWSGPKWSLEACRVRTQISSCLVQLPYL